MNEKLPTGNRAWVRRAATVAATGGLVLGGLAATATAASAAPIKEGTIKSECREAGGTYHTSTVEGTRFTGCHYKDNEGNRYVDYYVNGNYYSTKSE